MRLSFALLLLGHIIAVLAAYPPPKLTEYLLISISVFPESTAVVEGTASYFNAEWTSTNTITLPASPTDLALKTLRTYTEVSYSSKSGTPVAYVVLFTGGVTPATTFPTPAISTTLSSESSTSYPPTVYAVPITYYPWPVCAQYSQTWTLTTDVTIPLPTHMASSFVPLSTGTAFHKLTDPLTYGVTHTSAVPKIFLNPSDVGSEIISGESFSQRPYAIRGCYIPTTTCNTKQASTATAQETCSVTFIVDPKIPRQKTDSEGTADTIFAVILYVSCIPGGWLVCWFVVGIFESCRQFDKAMKGQECRLVSCLPYCQWRAVKQRCAPLNTILLH